MADRLNVTELDFDSIKTNLRNFLRQQTEFQDYDFEGSGLSVLLDILAYNTHYNAYYLNMIANEAFLDSASLRNSVVSHAKRVGYTPRSARAPRAIVNVTIQTTNATPGSLTLPRGYAFSSSQLDGVSYKFVTTESTTTSKVGNNFVFTNVPIYQGQLVSYSYTNSFFSNPKQLFTIPDANIDTTTLKVSVKQSSSNTETVVYDLSTNALTVDSTSEVYYLQEGKNGQYEVYFGDDTLGKKIPDGGVITLEYLITGADASNKANSFVSSTTVGGFSLISVNSITAAAGGVTRESVDSIKFAAPLALLSQNRAVTKNDYIKLIQQNYPAFEAVNVWGGEENDPPVYGVVFVAIKPSGGFLLTQSQKSIIEEEIIKPISVLTVQPRIIDVDYNYLIINSNVLYEPKLTTLTSSQLQSQVLTAIQGFASDTLNTFNSTFQLSTLISTVQSVSSSFVTNDASITLQKRIIPSLTSPTTYTLKYGTSLRKDIFGKSISVAPTFQVIDTENNNVVRESVYLEETPSSTTFVESISILNPGFGYTSTPTVTILGDGTGATARATVVNGQIDSITMIDVGVNYTQAIVQITSTDGNGSLASAVAVLAGNQGTLRTYYFENNVKKILSANAGTVNYAEGIVTLTDFNPSAINSPLGVLSIQAVPTTTIISSVRDKIITLDNTDPNAINVNIVAKV